MQVRLLVCSNCCSLRCRCTPVPQMSVIEEKLRELDDERKELAEYTRLDKQRRYVF